MTSDRTSNDGAAPAESGKAPTVIKKYANRRLYNTGTSAYVTLEDLATMVKHGDDFVVYDAKNGEDITRPVLAQIIFEQEGKGQSLMPITFLRQLIRFYGDSMQMLVPSYLEFSLAKLAQERGGFGQLFGGQPFGGDALSNAARPVFAQIEEQTRQNMAMFRQALSMFTPFPAAPAQNRADAAPQPQPTVPAEQNRAEFDDMRRQLDELQRRIEGLTPKG